MSRSHANRGRRFEQLIEAANRYYFAHGQAVVQKVATPMIPLRGPQREDGRRHIERIVPRRSTVDFVGVAEPGVAVAFDAKETAGPRWSLDNIELHQVMFLDGWSAAGGVAFVLVEFSRIERVFYLSIDELHHYLDRATAGGRKSIALAEFEAEMTEIKLGGRGVVLDYLSVVRERAA